jgi:nitrous oxidase accessory protein NosD
MFNKVISSAILFVLITTSFVSATDVSGTISADTTWSGPVTMAGNVVVNQGITLTVQAGSIVTVNGNFSLTVNGALNAAGSDTSKIVFRGAGNAITPGQWVGLIFSSTSGFPKSVIDNVEILNAQTGIAVNSMPTAYEMVIKNSLINEVTQRGISITNSVVTIQDVEIRNFGVDGFRAEGGSRVDITGMHATQQRSNLIRTGQGAYVHNVADVRIRQSTFELAHHGIYLRNVDGGCGTARTRLTVDDSVIRLNRNGVHAYGQANHLGQHCYAFMRLNGNDIQGNIDWNVYLGGAANAASTLLDFTNNWWGTADGVAVAGKIHDASYNAGVGFVDYLPMLNASKDTGGETYQGPYKAGWVTGEEVWSAGDYVMSGRVVIQPGASLTIEAGATMRFGPRAGLEAQGTLSIEGTSTSPVVATSQRTQPSAGDWNGIRLLGSGAEASSIEYLQIRYATTGLDMSGTSRNALSDIVVQGLSVRDVSFNGVVINDALVDMQNVSVLDVGQRGIYVINTVANLNGVEIRNFGIDGFRAEGGGSRVDITGMHVTQQRSNLVRTGQGAYVHNVADVRIRQSTFELAHHGIYLRNVDGGCGTARTRLTVDDSVIRLNRNGVHAYGQANHLGQHCYAFMRLNGNDIQGNIDWNVNLGGAANVASTLLDFTNNWWGTADGVAVAGKIHDASYNAGVGFVDYLPMLNASKDTGGETYQGPYKAGWVTGEEVWSAGDYVVSGRVVIQPGATLTIEAGATMRFGPRTGLEAHGTLSIEGTSTSPVVATSQRTQPSAGDWNGIRLLGFGSDASSIQHLQIRYATTGLDMSGTSRNALSDIVVQGLSVRDVSFNGVVINDALVDMQNVSVLDVGQRGIYVINTVANLNGVEIRNFGIDGFRAEGGGSRVDIIGLHATQQRSNLIRTGQGAYVHNVADVRIRQSTFELAHHGIYLRNVDGGCGTARTRLTVDDSVIRLNRNGVHAYGQANHLGQHCYAFMRLNGNDIQGNIDWNVYLGGAANAASTLLDFTNNWWGTADGVAVAGKIHDASYNAGVGFVDYLPMLNASKDTGGETYQGPYKAGWVTGEEVWSAGDYVMSGRVVIQPGASLTIEAGATMRFGPRAGLEAQGTLSIEGTSTSPVVATSQRTQPSAGDWNGIRLLGSGAEASSIEYLQIRYATTGLDMSGTSRNALSDIVVQGLSVRDVSFNGVVINDALVDMQNVSVLDVGQRGIYVINTVANLNGVEIRNFGIDGFRAEGGGSRVDIIGLHATQQRSNLIRTGQGAYVHNVADVRIRQSTFELAHHGIYLRNVDGGCGTARTRLTVDDSVIRLNRNGVHAYGQANHLGQHCYAFMRLNGNDIQGNIDWNVNLGGAANVASTLLDFTNNWWGTAVADDIEPRIHHSKNNANVATVAFRPFLRETKDVRGIADINKDGRTDGYDLAILATSFGLSEGHASFKPEADIYSDGRIDGFDLAILGINFGKYGSGGIMEKSFFVQQDAPATLMIDVNRSHVVRGDTITYTIRVDNVPALAAFATNLMYDSRLRFVGVTEAGFISFDNRYNVSTMRHLDSQSSTIIAGFSRLGIEDETVAEGSGVIAELRFVASEDIAIVPELHLDPTQTGLFSPDGLKYNFEFNQVPTSIIETTDQQTPEQLTLHQNFPNPFNPTTTISYEIPHADYVKLVVYDVNGRVVSTLVDGQQSAGTYQIVFNARELSSGVYIIRLITTEGQKHRTMTLIK